MHREAFVILGKRASEQAVIPRFKDLKFKGIERTPCDMYFLTAGMRIVGKTTYPHPW